MSEPSSGRQTAGEEQFAAWLESGAIPEIRSGVQQRSMRTAYTLLQCGFDLLRTRAFDALSIEELCAAAGATIGAFYGRFQDKQSFFSAMQRVTCLRSEAALAAFIERVEADRPSLETLCRLIVQLSVQRYRDNVGIYRAALQHAGEGAWLPFRRLGDSYRRALTELLSPHMKHIPKQARAVHIQFAYQVLVGTLVHATLNDPGPLHLQDEELVTELTGMILSYLGPRAVG